MESKKATKTQNQFSFFDAPLPHYNEPMFRVDPAISGRKIVRPSRPIGRISTRYATKPIKTIVPVSQEADIIRACNEIV